MLDELQKKNTLNTDSDATRHVLVVDDDPDINMSISAALKNKGYRVSIAQDGNQGVAYAESSKPDLVILDLMMPRRSGFFGA